MRKIILVFQALLPVFPVFLVGQNSISGNVKDFGDDTHSVAGANVFLPEIKVGTLTDSLGHFDFHSLPNGDHLIQVSCLGYETWFKTIRLSGEPIVLNISLRESSIEFKEVKIFGTRNYAPKESPYRIEQLGMQEARENGALSVSDAVAKLPGVSQLTTGAGISKPVIRGLYGNRVQVNVMGLRFDNQQWQDEHGLGLSTMGIDRIEIVKGPAALAFGSDAIGGVLNVIEEKPATLESVKHEMNLKMLSNTLGLGFDYGYRKTTQKNWKRLHVGFENNADYSSSGNHRVLNSRFASYNLKASTGKLKGNHYQNNSVYFSFSQFGFVFDTLNRKELDARISRTFDGPHHSVFFGMGSSENIFFKEKMKFKLNAGLISNLRQEQEGGNRISLNMLLNTLSVTGQAIIPLGKSSEWTNGVSLMGQSNTNFGSRTIIPDAITFEGGAFSIFQYRFKKGLIETGARYDVRDINTFETSILNGPGSEIQPFSKIFGALNGNAGVAWNPLENLSLKANASTGYRSGNLAELSSNGLHEGTARWEIGNPNLKVEQNLCMEAGATYELGEEIEIGATAFLNRFFNYIYLAPDGTEYVGFFIYRFIQTNATLRGAEFNIDFNPRFAKWLDLKGNYSLLQAYRDDGDPLPFIPANKINGEIKVSPGKIKKASETFVKAGVTYVFAQTHPAQFETETPGYCLFNAALGGKFLLEKNSLGFILAATNVTDKQYADHLSRFKYYGIYNMGMNITLSLNYQF